MPPLRSTTIQSWLVALMIGWGVMGGLFGLQQKVSAQTTFEERLIRGQYGYAYGIAAADLDGDRDLDLVSSDTTDDKTPAKDNGTLLWFENDGQGNFRERIIDKNESGWFERLAVGDINGDKHPDVAVVLNRHGSLVWFQNSGQPAEQAWKRHNIVNRSLPGAYDVALADFDGDGRLDAAASSWTRGSRFMWYRNPGPEGFVNPWPEQLIEADLSETRTIQVADFNRDGRPDLLGSASGASLVVWYENQNHPENAVLWTRHGISSLPAPIHGHPVDLDRDGDVDVLMAHGMRRDLASQENHKILWYENVGMPGMGTEWRTHVVGLMPDAFEATAADLDADGRLDVVATAWGSSGQIVWFQNPGSDTAEMWKVTPLKQPWVNANQVIAADLDANGRIDIAATAERGANEFRWWKNLSLSSKK